MILRILGDGNCFFRAISQFLYGQQDRHMEIREAAMNDTLDIRRWELLLLSNLPVFIWAARPPHGNKRSGNE